MKLIAGIFVTLFLIMTNEAQTCTQIQGCDLRISDRCYAYVDDNLNWNQAESCCVAWGGHLASIHSSDDNDILNNIRNQSRCTWIGLSNTANVSEYAWSDGTPNDYNNYYSGPPGSNGEVCFHYLSEDSFWNDYDCSSDTYVDQGGISYPISYICQKIVSEDQFCTPIQGCDVTLNGSCYAHVDDSLNWNQAEDCCVAWGGHLASIHSNDTNTILNSIRNQNRFTWIGLSDTANDSVYVWTDGTQYDHENFTSGQPDSYNGESCFHFFNGALTWNDNVCGSDTFDSILTSYICQKFISEDQFCTPIQGCDVTINGSCYAYVDDSLNWNQAEDCCVAWGGHLASIHSNDVNTILNRTSYICQKWQFTSVCDNRVISDVSVTGGICYEESLTTDMRDWNSAFNNCSSTNRRLARVLNEEMNAEIERITQSTEEYWIGLSRSDSNSMFMWSDGTSVSDTRWSSGHPIDGLNCVSVRGDSTEWYSSNCSDVKRYVCETDVCENWTVRNGICYKTFDTMNADAAVSLCQSHNAYLAEIPNIYVDNVITEIIGDLSGGGNEHWIGLRTNDTHYYWRIGDFSLGNDTPSNDDRNRCGRVDGDNGNRWDIRECNGNRRAICMIGPLTNEIPIERCENSSADTLVYEDSCYTRITVNERNLDRATLNCTDYYNGTLYDLSNTTVNEEIRRKFGSGSDLTIVDPNEYSRFTAQDGYFNLYTSFEDSNYPTNPNTPNCVTINFEGILSSSGNCPGDDHSYICKRAKTTTTTTIAPTTTTMQATTTTTSSTISPPTYSNYSYTYPCDNVIDNIDNTGGVCYTANSTDNVTWDSANMTCVENGNSRLAKALVYRMSAEIARITQDTDEYWIGLSRPDNSSEFMWSDGTSVSDTIWSSGHPIDGLNCVSVRGDSRWWYSSNCSDVKRYVCETDVCEDWTVRNGICYKKFDSNTSWTDSVEFCKNETAFLAEIPNIFINDIITYLIPFNEECYIGLYEDSTGLSWRIGEFALTESNSTSVAATSADIRYGTVNGSGRWDLGDGDTDRCVVCMRGNPSLPQSFSNYQCNIVTVSTMKDTVYDSSCYRRLDTTPYNLDIIAYRCQNFENGELYAFDNTDLNKMLLERFETDTFLIQSRNQYTGFIPPNNSFNLLLTNETYNFSDYTCEIVSEDGPINTYTPPEMETCEGSSRIYFCKTDYTPYFNILNKITFNETLYQLIADNRNFDEARDYCNNQKGTNDMNGHLMEILNQQQQQQVLLNLTSTVNQYVDEYYWIGLEYTNSDYVWTSGEVANYIENITNLTDTDSYCVAVDRDGKWLGLDCSDRYSFICQRPHVPPTAVTNATNMSTSTATSMSTSTASMATIMSTSTATIMSTSTATSMSTSTPTIMTTSMSTSTPTIMTTSMSTSTPTSTTMDLVMMVEKFLEEFLKKYTNLTVGGNATQFNEEINADIITVHLDSNKVTAITFENVTVGIGSDSFQANAIIVSAVYRNISDFTSSDMILSDVITIVSSEELSGNLTITFTIIQISRINDSSCYSFQNGTWVTDGIGTTRMENTVICETSHLTTFAVLINPNKAEGDHSQYQAYISVILCGLSLVALLTTIILYLCLGKKFFRKDINIIQLNFVIALCFALITFFLLTIPYFAMTALPPQACGAIALLTQYCWLSVFSWNFCQALHIILALFGNKLPFERHYIPLILIGWGVPIPIVLATLAVGLVQGEYQHADSCFLSNANGLIWAFLGPICFILLVNTCILIFIIIVSIYVQRKRRHKLAYSWRLVIGIATTIPLLGLPWVVGLLLRVIPNTDTTFIAVTYIFIIVNASQGLIFFVAHVLRNQEIRTLCSSSLKADIDIHPDDKEKKKERESIEGKLRGTEGTFSLRHDVIATHFSNTLEKNEMFQNDYTDRV